MPHSTQWMANSNTSAQAMQSCTSPPKTCVIMPNIGHSEIHPIMTSSSSKPGSTSSGINRAPGLPTHDLELSSSRAVAALDFIHTTTSTRSRRDGTHSNSNSKMPVLVDHVPHSSIQAKQFYTIIPPSSTQTHDRTTQPLVPSKFHNQIEAEPSADQVVDPSSSKVVVPELEVVLAEKPPSRSTKVKKSAASKAGIRRSTRKNCLPLGPRHLEWEYHDARAELHEATAQAVFELGYDCSRIKAGKSVLRETRPSLGEVMRMRHPAVMHARRRVDEADKILNDALARGFTWENTPLPVYEVVKDEEGNIVEATMIEDPLNIAAATQEIDAKSLKGSKRKHEQDEKEQEEQAPATRKRRVTKPE